MLVGQIWICDGNKPQIQPNHIIIHLENLYFLLKAINGLNYKFTSFFFQEIWEAIDIFIGRGIFLGEGKCKSRLVIIICDGAPSGFLKYC